MTDYEKHPRRWLVEDVTSKVSDDFSKELFEVAEIADLSRTEFLSVAASASASILLTTMNCMSTANRVELMSSLLKEVAGLDVPDEAKGEGNG